MADLGLQSRKNGEGERRKGLNINSQDQGVQEKTMKKGTQREREIKGNEKKKGKK